MKFNRGKPSRAGFPKLCSVAHSWVHVLAFDQALYSWLKWSKLDELVIWISCVVLGQKPKCVLGGGPQDQVWETLLYGTFFSWVQSLPISYNDPPVHKILKPSIHKTCFPRIVLGARSYAIIHILYILWPDWLGVILKGCQHSQILENGSMVVHFWITEDLWGV